MWTMDRIGVSFLDPLDDYELIHRIGSGTYGDVFKVSESFEHHRRADERKYCHFLSVMVSLAADIGFMTGTGHLRGLAR